MRARQVLSLVVFGLVALALYTFDQLRTRQVTASEDVVWTCTDQSRLHGGPVVILRFVRASEYFDYREDPTGAFCRFVSERGRPAVTMVVEVNGNKRDGMSSWTGKTMDGATIPLGGDGTEGQPTYVFPYQQDFNAARHRGFSWLR